MTKNNRNISDINFFLEKRFNNVIFSNSKRREKRVFFLSINSEESKLILRMKEFQKIFFKNTRKLIKKIFFKDKIILIISKI